MDGIRLRNNPDRVPPLLEALDPNQAGLPRIIHPIAMAVGSNERTDPMALVTTMDAEHQFEVTEDGTYVNDQGDPFWFPKGHRLPLAVAVKFEDFRGDLKDEAVPGTQNARVEAPVENRMEPAPENRQETAAQRKAREKAEKEAAAQAEADRLAAEKETAAQAEADRLAAEKEAAAQAEADRLAAEKEAADAAANQGSGE
jgi:hypothetical protein